MAYLIHLGLFWAKFIKEEDQWNKISFIQVLLWAWPLPGLLTAWFLVMTATFLFVIAVFCFINAAQKRQVTDFLHKNSPVELKSTDMGWKKTTLSVLITSPAGVQQKNKHHCQQSRLTRLTVTQTGGNNTPENPYYTYTKKGFYNYCTADAKQAEHKIGIILWWSKFHVTHMQNLGFTLYAVQLAFG